MKCSVKSDKILLESQRSEVEECQRKNNPSYIISTVVIFLWSFILCATEFQGAHLPCSHVHLSAFFKHHSTYLQDNEQIELCDVARAFVQISAKWPAVQKVWPPLG